MSGRLHQISDVNLRRLLRARDLMHDCSVDTLSLDEMAEAAGLSPSFFLRQFTAAFGRTPHRYLTTVRIERARRLLAHGRPVTEVCLDVGFSSLGSFSALFHRQVGLPPSRWQRQIRRSIAVPEQQPALWIPSCYLMAYTQSNFGEAGAAGDR